MLVDKDGDRKEPCWWACTYDILGLEDGGFDLSEFYNFKNKSAFEYTLF